MSSDRSTLAKPLAPAYEGISIRFNMIGLEASTVTHCIGLLILGFAPPALGCHHR